MTIVLTHVNKLNKLELNKDLIDSINSQSTEGDFYLVINNPQGKMNIDKAIESFNAPLTVFKGIITSIDIGVSKVRNFILNTVKDCEDYTHVTFIDGDDNIQKNYVEVLNKYLNRVKTFLVFTCQWYKTRDVHYKIYPEYAVHYVNWCYLWNIDFLRRNEVRYPSTSNQIPEDEMLYAYLLQIRREFRFLDQDLYIYNYFNAGISKLDSEDSRELVKYLTFKQCKIIKIN